MSNKRQVVVLSVSIAAIGVAAVLFNSGPPPNAPPAARLPPKLDTDEVLVAAQDLPMGASIAEPSVIWQVWPKASISEQMIVKSSGPNLVRDIAGFLTRTTLLRGEPMRRDKLIKAGSGGFMSAILPSGMRAVAIKIDNGGDSEAGGFILPNDRVDVVRVYRDDEATKARGTEILESQTILTNVRVLAIGKEIEDENHKKVANGGNATLELDPAQANLVVLAQHIPGSNLHLILRSLADSSGSTETVADLDDDHGKSGGLTIVRFGVKEAVR
jgi:pilus assembly protein CpaB